MIDQVINCKNINKAKVVIMSVGYDKTSSFRKGADKGPREIVSCLNRKIELFEKFTKTVPAQLYKTAEKKLENINRYSLERMVEVVKENFSKIYKKGKFVIMLGGSHSISIGVFQALANIEKSKNITIVQIDAHLDMRDDDSEYNDKNPDRYAHSCVMRRAYDLGFKTVQVGIRDYSKEDYQFVTDNNLIFFEWGIGEEPKIEKILKSIKTKDIYLNIDIDGLDSSIAPATGTPVPGGISWKYIQKLIIELFKHKNIIAADIVEVAPRPDDVITQYTAAQLCYNIIAYKFSNKKLWKF